MDRTKEQVAQSIIKFAERTKLHIHPGRDPYQWAEQVLIADGCPCVPGRPSCPCAFVKEDIKEFGRCRCGLFTNDGYLDNYNSLRANLKRQKEVVTNSSPLSVLPPMSQNSRGDFLKKISINGFSIEDSGDTLTLRPRGAETTAEVIIKEVEPNVWQVVGASGAYSGFYRGKKRSYFESYINRWAAESIFQSQG